MDTNTLNTMTEIADIMDDIIKELLELKLEVYKLKEKIWESEID